MKIAQISPYFYPVTGGMENHVLEISKRLSRYYEVTIITSNRDRNGKKLPIYEKLGKISIIRANTLIRTSEFSSFFPAAFELSKNYDLLHIHAYRHPHNLIPIFTKRPSILTPHYPVYPFSSKKRRFFISIYDRIIGRKVLFSYKKIIALTQGEKDWLIKSFGIPENKITIIPNGIPEIFLKRHNSNEFREKFSIPKDKFLILAVGRIHFSKGFQDLILAYKMLPENIRENIILAIVGPDGGYLTKLKELVSLLKLEKNVIFVGEIPEDLKLSAYESCDLFVLPSYWEGFGITLLEAMAKDKPVLARNTGGQKWVVPEKEFLFEDVESLSEKIKLIYLGKIKKNLNYREIVKKNYMWNKIVEKIIKIYEEVLSNNNSI
jgi:glycosyltransferase involved in cell wall biosynthesis